MLLGSLFHSHVIFVSFFTFPNSVSALVDSDLPETVTAQASPLSTATDPPIWKFIVQIVTIYDENDHNYKQANTRDTQQSLPTEMKLPKQRQDFGAVQALRNDIEQLSLSISSLTYTSSSMSAGSLSLIHAADAAVRSANAYVAEANQYVSSIEISASAVISQISQAADNQLSDLARSFTAQFSSDVASVQESANATIDQAQAMADAEVQAVRASATAAVDQNNVLACNDLEHEIASTTTATSAASAISASSIEKAHAGPLIVNYVPIVTAIVSIAYFIMGSVLSTAAMFWCVTHLSKRNRGREEAEPHVNRSTYTNLPPCHL